jgi:opacity protein-like surface antigen
MSITGRLLLAAAVVGVFSGSALAADFSAPSVASGYQPPAATDWDGPYVGASIGYGWGNASDNGPAGGGSVGTDGWLIGGQLGYNFHLSDIIVGGVEGNVDWDNQSGVLNGVTVQRNWDGSARARLGVDVDGILPYAEAGVAFANASAAGDGNTQTGWTAGLGMEFKMADQVSANVDYRYSDYGDGTYAGESVGLTDNTLRAGLNYHF